MNAQQTHQFKVIMVHLLNQERLRRNELKAKAAREFRRKNPDKVERDRAKHREWYWKNPEKQRAYTREYLKRNPNTLKNWRATLSAEEKKEKAKAYNAKYPGKLNEIQQKYRSKHRAKINKKWNLYVKNRCAKDPVYKLQRNLRSLFRKVLDRKKVTLRSLQILGCTYPELKAHIEKRFLPGMTWDNWSLFGWHIDHILPVASFDLTNPEEVKKCFGWKNLQPLWAVDNRIKSDKILQPV